MISISATTLHKVNRVRQQTGLTEVSEAELRQLLDWTDLPRSANLTAACLPRFSEILGYRVTNNTDGGLVFLCVDSNDTAVQLGVAIDGLPHHWTTPGPLSPHDYLGHTVLLTEDLVNLAKEASRAVLETWKQHH